MAIYLVAQNKIALVRCLTGASEVNCSRNLEAAPPSGWKPPCSESTNQRSLHVHVGLCWWSPSRMRYSSVTGRKSFIFQPSVYARLWMVWHRQVYSLLLAARLKACGGSWRGVLFKKAELGATIYFFLVPWIQLLRSKWTEANLNRFCSGKFSSKA